MIAALDHVVIGVSDPDESGRRFEASLGLTVSAGGRHPDLGTRNLLIRFAREYLELIGLDDEDRARRADGGRRRRLVDALAAGGGLLAYALRSSDLDADVARLRSGGIPVGDASPGRRRRPDGRVLEWRYAFVGGPPWRSSFPFLIEWSAGDDLRLGPEAPPAHRMGAHGIARVSVAAADVGAALAMYERLGIVPSERRVESALIRVGSAEIELLDGHVDDAPDGVCRVALAVRDLDASTSVLAANGTAIERVSQDGAREARIVLEAAGGIDLRLVEV